MAYEYQTPAGVVRLLRTAHCWTIEFKGEHFGRWRLPDDAAAAAASGQGIPLSDWERARLIVPEDLLRWRPIGGSL